MSKLVEVKITKGLLVLPENCLAKYLPPDIYIEALKRGKAFKRSRQLKERCKGGAQQWSR